MTLNYRHNIHGLLWVSSNVDVDIPDYFKIEQNGTEGTPAISVSVDRDIKLGNERLAKVGLHVIYDESTDTLCFKHPRSSSHFPIKLAVKQLAEPVTYLYATNIYNKFAPTFARSNNVKRIVRNLVGVKLIQNNHSLVHAGCVDLDGYGVLVAAFGDTGKTSSTLALITTRNWRFLSDDTTLLNQDGSSLCYPEASTITARTLQGTNLRLGTLDSMKLRIARALYRLHPTTNAAFHTDIKVPVQELIPRERIISKTKIRGLVFLEKGEEFIKEIDKDRAISKLLLISEKEIDWSTNSLTLFYSYFNEEFDLEHLIEVNKKIVGRVVDNTEKCFVLRSPTNHSKQINHVF